ncbi:hypothetical protein TI05_07835 [Achromatium sp. WMS3]|nr:hypothetical protein TI05_07835 [Achromatium sp. WMS3]
MASVAKAFIGYVNKPSAFYLETIKFAIWLDMASFICFYKVFFVIVPIQSMKTIKMQTGKSRMPKL